MSSQWWIRKDVVLTPNLVDCHDDFEGVCLRDLSLEECKEYAFKNGSEYGTYIHFKNGDSVCSPTLPLRSRILNPYLLLKEKSVYPELNNVDVYTFINKNKYPIMTDDNSVYFFQPLSIKMYKNQNISISKCEKENPENTFIIFGDCEKDQNIQFVPSPPLFSLLESSIKVLYGHVVNISLPFTALLLSSSLDNRLGWSISHITGDQKSQDFYIMPEDTKDLKSKLLGTPVHIGEPFYLLQGNMYIQVDNNIPRRVSKIKDATLFILSGNKIEYNISLKENNSTIKKDIKNDNQKYKSNSGYILFAFSIISIVLIIFFLIIYWMRRSRSARSIIALR